MLDECALAFDCEGETLVGILSPAATAARRGVLVIVGGPQYRAGSHRQFALLARQLAAQGIPALRFDYRGLGDSSGAARTFEHVAADIRSAIDAFQAAVPGLQEVVLWGLCDAAAAALFYGRRDPRVTGLVLLNPWARSAAGLARSTLKHYYWARLRDPALWRKLARGQ
ncbi:MAG TPA: hydrolase 1, exosortase A system-associated, partial [Pseudoduganella sp.]